LIAKKNFVTKVAMVDSQTSRCVCLSSASSAMCIPRASEKASATATVRTPPITASLEWVPECSPTIRPRVVIMAEVRPKTETCFKGMPHIKGFLFFDFKTLISSLYRGPHVLSSFSLLQGSLTQEIPG